MASPDDLSYLQVRCAKQGEALWHQFTVREVFGGEEGVSEGHNAICCWGCLAAAVSPGSKGVH